MTLGDLGDDIAVELALLEAMVGEAVALLRDVGQGEATVRERTAAAAFLAQFYGGVENVMKRLCRFHGVALPVGETAWEDRTFVHKSIAGLAGGQQGGADGSGEGDFRGAVEQPRAGAVRLVSTQLTVREFGHTGAVVERPVGVVSSAVDRVGSADLTPLAGRLQEDVTEGTVPFHLCPNPGVPDTPGPRSAGF